MDVDSIKNHLESAIIMGEEESREASKLKKELKLELLMEKLYKMINK